MTADNVCNFGTQGKWIEEVGDQFVEIYHDFFADICFVFHGSGQWRQSMDQLRNSQRPAFRGLQIYDGFVAFKGTG